MDEDWDALSQEARRLTAERFRRSLWWEQEKPTRRRVPVPKDGWPSVDDPSDDDVTTARRRKVLAEVSGDEEEQVKHG